MTCLPAVSEQVLKPLFARNAVWTGGGEPAVADTRDVADGTVEQVWRAGADDRE